MGAAWTTGQIRLLRQIYRTASREKLERELAPHSWNSILTTAHRLGLRRPGDGISDWRTICASHIFQTRYFAHLNRRMEAAE